MQTAIQKIKIPSDRPVWHGAMATYWFEDGVLVSLSISVRRTVSIIADNVALVKQITANKRVPLLIYLADSPVPDKAARKFSTEQLPVIYSAMAMVSKPGLSRLIMRLLFKFKTPPIPMRSFTDDKAAKEWLRQFVQPL